MITEPGAYVIQTLLQVYTSKTVSEVLLQNARKSFSIKLNPNNCELNTMA